MRPGFEPLEGAVPFDSGPQKSESKSEPKGKISIRGVINIDNETGTITIKDDKDRIGFSFVNKEMAKKWSGMIG